MTPSVIPEKPLSVHDFFRDKVYKKGDTQQVRIEFKHYEDQEHMELRVWEQGPNGWSPSDKAIAIPIGSLEGTFREMHNVQKLIQIAQRRNNKAMVNSLLMKGRKLQDKAQIENRVITEMGKAALKALYWG